MARGKILVVDDEPQIVDLVRLYLQRDGYQVTSARDGQEALTLFHRDKPDLVVLDLMLPEVDGIEVCRQIRRHSSVPIIMLTARSEDMDKLLGLELGADDYVTKPFSPRELVARVGAVLRRTRDEVVQPQTVMVGTLKLDLEKYQASCHGQPLDLTAIEFKLLATLARSPGRVFTRLQILDQVHGDAFEGYERTIDAHIKNLRHKFPEGKGCRIVTVHGIGYKLEEA